jgi:hypothetical protein
MEPMNPAHRTALSRLALAGLVAAAFASAGCSPADRDADAGTAAPAAAPASATPSSAVDAPLDLCQLMPQADVAATLQANNGGTVSQSKRGYGGMCSYLHVPKPGDYQVKLLIDFARSPSTDDAVATMKRLRQDFAERGYGITDVAGVGDEAFASDAEGTEGLKIRIGRYTGQINLTVDERPPASLRPAVVALGKQVVTRLSP